ncbi:uncharacterized protein LOC126899586 [Daktulosphaira vitifoliae]|uniref:uncharacterized protein LOC126899586 n=1 Tax=Daktulosphaira vitifoliae TaxID=58002 RepID=UPI0021AA8A14|nr:uncharacterized protein LOC126899586 [Daktulosphaira vitifoliae]
MISEYKILWIYIDNYFVTLVILIITVLILRRYGSQHIFRKFFNRQKIKFDGLVNLNEDKTCTELDLSIPAGTNSKDKGKTTKDCGESLKISDEEDSSYECCDYIQNSNCSSSKFSDSLPSTVSEKNSIQDKFIEEINNDSLIDLSIPESKSSDEVKTSEDFDESLKMLNKEESDYECCDCIQNSSCLISQLSDSLPSSIHSGENSIEFVEDFSDISFPVVDHLNEAFIED